MCSVAGLSPTELQQLVSEVMETGDFNGDLQKWRPGVLPARTRHGVRLLNARHMKAVPGRKTDVKD